LDATHFRLRAARARELAQSGDDVRLSRMLLDVAVDLDAEAEAIESGSDQMRRGVRPERRSELRGALLHVEGSDAEPKPVQVIALSSSAATLRLEGTLIGDQEVILELPGQSLRLRGTASSTDGCELAIVFESSSREDPALVRLIRSGAQQDQARA
jgi:hypothetical protein